MRPLPDDGPLSWVAALGITLVAGLLRFWHLSQPRGKMFDEIYYACDSQSLLKHGVEVALKSGDQACTEESPVGPGFIAHPPLGKWIIGIGQQLFGYNETGWRVMSALLGTLSVLVLIRAARRMFGSTLLGCVAGLLLTLDGMALVLSRTAVLDGMLMFFVLVAFACLLIDRDDGRRRLATWVEAGPDAASRDRGPRLGFRWWRLGAAVALAAACSVKWSGLFFVLLFPLLALTWDIGARRSAGISRAWVAALRRDLLPLVLLFGVLVPVLYTASWTGWFLADSRHAWDRNWAQENRSHWWLHVQALGFSIPIGVPDAISNALPESLRSFMHYHWAILDFHTGLHKKHGYQSHPIGWLLLARPVSFFYTSPKYGELGCTAPAGCSREVLLIGTPAIWWTSIPALVLMAWYWVSRRDWRPATILLCFLVGIVPWIPSDLDGRTMFNFYAAPVVPFMVLAITYVIGKLIGRADADDARRTWGAVAAGAYLLLVVLNFFYLYPVLVGEVIPYEHWHKLMWLGNNWI